MSVETPASKLPSILVPCLNEAECIESVLRAVPAEYAAGVLVIDGGSTDGTVEKVRGLGFRVIRQPGRGLGRAVVAGIEGTAGPVIVTIDADGSHDAADIPRLLAKIDEGYDLVIASRYSDGPEDAGMFSPRRRSTSADDTPIREFGNRAFTWLCRVLFGVPAHDTLNGFKAFRRPLFDTVKIEQPGQEYDIEVLLKAHLAGFRIGEVPIVEHLRLAGDSKLSVPYHGARILWVILRERMTSLGRRRPR